MCIRDSCKVLLVKLRAQSGCIMATCLYILLSSSPCLSLQTDIQYDSAQVSTPDLARMSDRSVVLHRPDCNKIRQIKSVLLSNAGEAHLEPQVGSQAQLTRTNPPPETKLAGTAQLSLEMLKRTDTRTEVAKIRIMQKRTHVRRSLQDVGTGMGTVLGTDVGTGLGTGMQMTDMTITGRTKLRAGMV